MDLPPFLSYAASYALFNYTLENPSRGYEYDNLRLIRGFEHGLDPKSSEAGFILTHVDMVKETAPLIHGAVQILDGVEHNSRRASVNEGFREILKAMEVIEASMEGKIILQSPILKHRIAAYCICRYVEKFQTSRLSDLPRLHIWHHIPVHVPQRSHLRRYQRQSPHVLSRRKWCQ